MKQKFMILGGLGLAAAAAVVFLMLGGQDAVTGYTLTEQPYVQTIQGTGRIRADRKVDILAQVNETLKQIPVKEGQAVVAGDILAVFDDQKQVLAMEQSRISLQTAMNRLSSIQGPGLEAAESLLRQTLLKQEEHQRLLERSEALFDAGALPETEMEALRLQQQLIEEEIMAARRAVRAKQPGGTEHQEALLSVAQAKSQLEQKQTDQQNYEIQAPLDGVIIKIQGTEGKPCRIGESLMTVAAPDTYRIRMDVDERYLGLLEPGQKAYFWLGEDAGQRHQGTVEAIARQIDAQTGTIEVKILMDPETAWLVEDLTLQTEIVVREASQGLLVPQGYLNNEAPYEVLVLQDGKAQPVAFEGLRIDQSQILVVEGLEEGSILLDPAQGINPGQTIDKVQDEGGADHAL